MTNEEINAAIKSILFPKDHKYHEKWLACAVCFEFRIKNWAESIEDAWGLFEEMNPGMFIFKSYEDCTWRVQYESNEQPNFMITIGIANTAPLAICNAWLKFKENNK